MGDHSVARKIRHRLCPIALRVSQIASGTKSCPKPWQMKSILSTYLHVMCSGNGMKIPVLPGKSSLLREI